MEAFDLKVLNVEVLLRGGDTTVEILNPILFKNFKSYSDFGLLKIVKTLNKVCFFLQIFDVFFQLKICLSSSQRAYRLKFLKHLFLFIPMSTPGLRPAGKRVRPARPRSYLDRMQQSCTQSVFAILSAKFSLLEDQV